MEMGLGKWSIIFAMISYMNKAELHTHTGLQPDSNKVGIAINFKRTNSCYVENGTQNQESIWGGPCCRCVKP